MGGKFHLKLNNGERPIANKYREGKMKRTLKRELKVLEIAGREANGSCGCTPVGCGTACAGPPLNAGGWSAWATAAGQVRGIVLRPMPLRWPRNQARAVK